MGADRRDRALDRRPRAGLRPRQEGRPHAVIVIKVQSHEWTPGDAWWEVGVPEVSTRKEVRAARAEFEKGKAKQRIGV